MEIPAVALELCVSCIGGGNALVECDGVREEIRAAKAALDDW
jgi:hypothetical protein